MKSVLQSLLVSLFGIVLSLILAEIAFRFSFDFFTQKTEWTDRPAFYFRDENAQTLQDRFHKPEKALNSFRIAVVGDSYTFAPYMQFTDTFPKKLEQMLNLNNVSLKAEVINYGVPAYSTSHEVAVVKKALEGHADMIIMQVTLNDAELKPYRPTGIKTDQPDRFGEMIFSGRLAKIATYWKSLGFVLTRLHNKKTHQAYKDYFIDLFENKRGWKSFSDSFIEIQKMCSENNVKLVGVVFPLFGLPLDNKYPFFVIHEKLAEFFKENSIEFMDLYPAYAGIPLDRIQVIPGIDRHPNEIAHRIAAEKIYQWLSDSNLIPSELKIKFKYDERMGVTGKGLIK